LFLRLRIVDFPFLHGGTIPFIDLGASASGTLAPAAFYVFGFTSGMVAQLFFRTTRRNEDEHSTVEKITAPE
jgi:hypothetical protein